MSTVCVKCQNVRLLLKGINTHRNTKKLTKHYPVVEFVRRNPKNDINTFPEENDAKEINYESRVMHKNGKTNEHTSTNRVGKKEKICNMVEKLLTKSESYLRRSHMLRSFPNDPGEIYWKIH